MTELAFDCRAVLERLDAYRLGELTPAERDALCAHLATCKYCVCVEKQEQALLERLRATCQNCCPDELRRRIMAACGCKGA